MKFNYKPIIYLNFVATFIVSCGATTDILSTPIENIDTSPLKVMELTEDEKKNWGHLDLLKDTIPGMAVDRAYAELIKNKKGKKVVVAVIDSGIDIDHEDLNDVIWTNKGEIPNNGKDDDNNGYVDDIHGWNFLGEAYDEQLEFVRIIAIGDTSNPDFNKAKAKYDEDYQLWAGRKTQYDQIAQAVKNADETLTKHFSKSDYTIKEVNAVEAEDENLTQAIQLAKNIGANGLTLAKANVEIVNILIQINERLNYHLNKNFSGRKTGDDINDLSDTGYGNGNVKPIKKGESHGTHVAGIIAAERNNEKGVNGVANNVEIMAIRTVPNGD